MLIDKLIWFTVYKNIWMRKKNKNIIVYLYLLSLMLYHNVRFATLQKILTSMCPNTYFVRWCLLLNMCRHEAIWPISNNLQSRIFETFIAKDISYHFVKVVLYIFILSMLYDLRRLLDFCANAEDVENDWCMCSRCFAL